MAPFFALKYAPPAMAKTTPKQAYPNAAPKDQKYGSIIVVSSVASTYGGKKRFFCLYFLTGSNAYIVIICRFANEET